MKISIRETGANRLIVHYKRIRKNMPVAMKNASREYAFDLVGFMREIIDTESRYHGAFPGELSNSFSVQGVAGNNSTGHNIISNSGIAEMVDQGTRPHTIVPVNAPKLVWVRNGRINTASSVSHPGARAMNFVDRAIEKSKRQYFHDIEMEIERTIRRS